MTQEEINKGNRLITEFMMITSDIWDIYAIPVDFNNSSTVEMYTINELKYHSSWLWLMPVVEKIEAINCADESGEYSFNVFIVYGDCSIKDDVEARQEIWIHKHSIDSKSKIEATWLAVVEFIKWYNQQVKS